LLSNKENLEQKIGEAIGLEKAAQVAVEELSAKGLLDKGGMKDKLQNMKKQANNHQTNRYLNQKASVLPIYKQLHKKQNKRLLK
jgi:hypothetical protein